MQSCGWTRRSGPLAAPRLEIRSEGRRRSDHTDEERHRTVQSCAVQCSAIEYIELQCSLRTVHEESVTVLIPYLLPGCVLGKLLRLPGVQLPDVHAPGIKVQEGLRGPAQGGACPAAEHHPEVRPYPLQVARVASECSLCKEKEKRRQIWNNSLWSPELCGLQEQPL